MQNYKYTAPWWSPADENEGKWRLLQKVKADDVGQRSERKSGESTLFKELVKDVNNAACPLDVVLCYSQFSTGLLFFHTNMLNSLSMTSIFLENDIVQITHTKLLDGGHHSYTKQYQTYCNSLVCSCFLSLKMLIRLTLLFPLLHSWSILGGIFGEFHFDHDSIPTS